MRLGTGVTLDRYTFKLIAGLCAVVVLVAMALIGGMSDSKLKMWLPGIMIATAFLVPVFILFAMLFWEGLRQ